MGLIYQETLQVKGYDVDKKGVIHVHRLVGLLLYVSSQQTKQLQTEQFDRAYLWFILQHDMTIHRLPRIDETIVIETEATSYNTFFTYRRFRVSVKDEVLVETEIKFAVVDKKERKLVKIEDWMVSDYQADASKKVQKFEKITLPEKMEKGLSYSVYNSDIDVNQHVNNAVYVRWIFDSLSSDVLEKYSPSTLSIAYEHEVLLGDEVFEKHVFESGVSYHVIEKNSVISAKCKIKWLAN